MKSWQASSLCSCPKAQYLRRKGVPVLSKPSAALLLRWSAGHHLESAIRDHVLALYPDAKSNQKYYSESLDLTGEYDNYSEKEKTLIEIKSVHDMAFIERDGVTTLKEEVGLSPNGRRIFEPKKEPYLHHLLQNYAYVLLLEEQGVKVEKTTIVYLSLSGRVVAYTTEVNPKYLEAVKRRLSVLNEAWKKQEAPDCICKESDPLWNSVLKYCDYRNEEVCCEEG